MSAQHLESWPIDRPIPYARNARIVPDAAIGKVAASIKEFGFRAPIIVDAADVIIAGHTRLLAAQRLGLESVPVLVASDLTPAQVKAYRLADNRTAQETSWDYALLNQELEELAALDFDVSLTAFDADELFGVERSGDERDDASFDGSLEYRVVIDCASEAQQREIIERAQELGWLESEIVRTPRVAQLEGMFDAPLEHKSHLEWHGSVPLDEHDWSVGLIVGPSGSGKSVVARELFGDAVDRPLRWSAGSVIDDFATALPMSEIADVCSAVGFNTISAWARPYSVLSNGERFRVELARRLLEHDSPIVVDEFSSVVDRQIAQIGSHAVQRYARRHGKRFVAVSCHYDIVDWLQPDWLLEPATMTFTRRERLRRPALDVELVRVHHSAWQLFAPFHYMSADLHKAARCFVLFVGERPAAFAGVMYRPISHAKTQPRPIYGLSRLVTLPDWQGLGLAPILADALGSAFAGIRARFRTYPAHPALIRSFKRSPRWKLCKAGGSFSIMANRPARTDIRFNERFLKLGGRPCAVFEYVGSALPSARSHMLLGIS